MPRAGVIHSPGRALRGPGQEAALDADEPADVLEELEESPELVEDAAEEDSLDSFDSLADPLEDESARLSVR